MQKMHSDDPADRKIPRSERKKPPKVGRRRRYNSYYEGMTRNQIILDTTKTVGKWLAVSVFLFGYWLIMLLLLSIFLLNVWRVTLVRLILYAAILGGVSSLIYGYNLWHKKFYY